MNRLAELLIFAGVAGLTSLAFVIDYRLGWGVLSTQLIAVGGIIVAWRKWRAPE